MTKQPKIKETTLNKRKLGKNNWRFLEFFGNKYAKILIKNNEIYDVLNASQNALDYYCMFYYWVQHGFLEMIVIDQMDGYFFNSPYLETIKKTIKSWGAIDFVELLTEAKKIYNKYKKKLIVAQESSNRYERLKILAELYINKEIPEFQPLLDRYFRILDKENWIIREYIEKNVNEFAVIV